MSAEESSRTGKRRGDAPRIGGDAEGAGSEHLGFERPRLEQTISGHARSEQDSLERARELILQHGVNTTSYQILNPGIQRWFSPRRNAVVGYVEGGGHRVVAGEPVSAEEDVESVVDAFESDSAAAGCPVVYFAAERRLARALASRGPWDRLYLGAQPVWRPQHWPQILASKASLRAQLHRALNKGVEVHRWSAQRAAGEPQLSRCLDEWLSTRGLPPLHFLVEPQTLGRLFDRQLFVAQQRGQVVGFLVLSPIPRRNGWLVEQNIRGAGAPNGTTELLLDGAMTAAAETGSNFVTLGLCPLSRRATPSEGDGAWGRREERLWLRGLLAWVRAHGRRFYNFDGLDAYKAKFLPEHWEPIYAITSERKVGISTLYAIAAAFGSTSPPVLLARALGRAVKQEARWLRQRWGG
ncbi:MAG: DUF2156 domain-containing protein [Acidobacteriota bacterium]